MAVDNSFTQLCVRLENCTRAGCTYAHSLKQLRIKTCLVSNPTEIHLSRCRFLHPDTYSKKVEKKFYFDGMVKSLTIEKTKLEEKKKFHDIQRSKEQMKGLDLMNDLSVLESKRVGLVLQMEDKGIDVDDSNL